jgi:4-hydroxyphenylpyruvate dioxygenase
MTPPFRLLGFDHIGFIVGNAKQAAQYYESTLGFNRIAYRGLETGERDVTSYVLRQNDIMFVLHTPLGSGSSLNDHLRQHGDGVRDIAFGVDDAKAAWESTTSRGATSVQEPTTHSDEHGEVITAAIQTYGDTVHTFIQRGDYKGPFTPGFQKDEPIVKQDPVGLRFVDHAVGNQPDGKMEEIANFYQEVFGFKRLWTVDDDDVSTEFTSLRSVVVSDDKEVIKMPINEPAEGKKKSQIQEYVDFYEGPGVQHLALYTDDIITTVEKLRARGVDFLPTPQTYYDELENRVGKIDEDIRVLAGLDILVDRDEDGYLLQLFTRPTQDRPTLFYEVIQRKGARSFGKGNFKALFESIEREQALRGNL